MGLKHARSGRNAVASCAFSRTPRGFEAQTHMKRCMEVLPFSRTPRGFEADTPTPITESIGLSAEPLVGLKQIEFDVTGSDGDTFSRTPRGFEACID